MNAQFFWILAAFFLAILPADAKTVVYRNGEIITVDAGFTIAKAMAVRDDRILAVGSEPDVLAAAGPAAEIVDLEGRAVIPGLIDNHIHAIRAAVTWADEVRLDGVRTRAEALARIRARAAAIPKGWWIYTLGGFSEEQFEDD